MRRSPSRFPARRSALDRHQGGRSYRERSASLLQVLLQQACGSEIAEIFFCHRGGGGTCPPAEEAVDCGAFVVFRRCGALPKLCTQVAVELALLWNGQCGDGL